MVNLSLEMPNKSLRLRFRGKRPYFQHYVIEILDLEKSAVKNATALRSLAKEFIKKAQLSVCDEINYKFYPRGTTIVFIMSSSHMSLHSWPENNYVHIDLLVCKKLRISTLKSLVPKIFKAKQYFFHKIDYKNFRFES